jgi:hypothetical protein
VVGGGLFTDDQHDLEPCTRQGRNF